MSESDLWKKYCSFYEKPFSEQLEYNKQRMKEYFEKWKKTDLAKMLCKGDIQSHRDVPVTTYGDYPMLTELGERLTKVTQEKPRRQNELLWEYYLRVSRPVASFVDRYMVEPFYFAAKTTGTTGASKWIAHGETFSQNLMKSGIASLLVACSDAWGETRLKKGDTGLNMAAPVPYISGWGSKIIGDYFKLIPPLEVTDNLQDMKKKFYLVLNSISRGERIDVAGGVGSIFYMICKYFVEPEEFYEEYYNSMSLGMKKMLLLLKLLQCKLSRKKQRRILDYLTLKGIVLSGVDARLYIDFIKKEFDLEPLHFYASTEAGYLMSGIPERKTDLFPDLMSCYLEFQTQNGEIVDLEELKRGETYNIIVTPFGSILFRYDMEDLFRVVDFMDNSMPVFAFEGRKQGTIDIYGYYRVTPHILVQALKKAGLEASDKWAVAKLLEPKEHICLLMEKVWPYSEEEAEKLVFEALKETHKDFRSYVTDFKIKEPSEAIKVEYLRPGAFLRYSAIKAKMGAPMGQYKPPQTIPPDRLEIYETLRSA